MSGGGNGGIGSVLETLAPAALMMIPGVGEALAPAMAAGMGGLGMGADTAAMLASYAAPALTGGVLSGGVSAITGNGNPLQAALMGGIGSGLGAGLTGEAGTAANGITGAGASPLAQAGISPGITQAVDAAGNSVAMNSPDAVNFGTPQADGSLNPLASGAGTSTSSSGSGGIMGYLGKKNPLSLALAGTTGLSALQALLPHKQVNVGQNAANVMATNPGFNATLPKYTQQNTGTPYSGDWYKYGYSPQPAMYNAMPQLQKRGGLIHGYAHGGAVRGYAAGGMPLAAPQMAPQGAPPAMPPQGMPQRPQAAVNPLALAAAHKVGVAIGQHLRKTRLTPPGKVSGAGGGQDDAIPAKLSDGEYILPSDVTSKLGDGSTNAGAKKLDAMVHHVRQHKSGSGFPPKARNPLSYIKKGA